MSIGRKGVKKSMEITKAGGGEKWHFITHTTSGNNPFNVKTTHNLNVSTEEAVPRNVGELFHNSTDAQRGMSASEGFG